MTYSHTVMTTLHKPQQPFAHHFIAGAAIILIANYATAQTGSVASPAPTPASAEATLKPVTISAPSASAQSDITGFGDTPLQRTPISANVIGAQQIEAVGAKRLADLIKLDASSSDAYNTIGYWDFATVRGFVLDNKFNYRRDGLPVSAETFIPLDNKERVEILKGTSGIQAGTSAPGGLINYAVKRPTAQPLRSIKIEASSGGALGAAADLGGRFGQDGVFGYRLNLAADKLGTPTPNTRGSRELAALAVDWRIGKDSLLEAEVEYSRRSQPSVPGLSLLGSALPPANPRLNINSQPWSLPVELQGTTASVRFEQAINTDWRWSAQLGTQRLKSQDRVAFPFGCTDSNGVDYYADRYCPNGDYDLYDFRSENERRTTNALNLQLKGKFATAGINHQLSLGILQSRFTEAGETGAYNYSGTVNLFAPQTTAPDASLTDFHTNRKDKSVELSASDAIQWNNQFSTWLGLRHTRLDRTSERTNPSSPRATSYNASVTTPWLGAAYQVTPSTMLYASWGQGIETQVVPNRASQYSNPGEALPPLKSRQVELGVKASVGNVAGSLAWFSIRRPISNLDACSRLGTTPCQGAYDGSAAHSGLEANAQWAQGPWSLGGGLMLLNAKREGSTLEPLNNGQRPANVPKVIARLNTEYRFTSLPGLAASAHVSHEGARNVLADGSVSIPAWTRLDAAVRYGHKMAGAQATWTLGVDNLLNKQYFKDAPYQFGHVYLFPQQQRTVRLGLSVNL
jgi:iron complex outermembrane recepter protein